MASSGEDIVATVASLPAPQMFEFMAQIKSCVENNPEEAEAMLMQNTPLIYSLLHAQLMMGLVDLPAAAERLSHAAPVPLIDPGDFRPEAEKPARAATRAPPSDPRKREARAPPAPEIRPAPAPVPTPTPTPAPAPVVVPTPAPEPEPSRPVDPRLRRAAPGDPRAAAQQRPAPVPTPAPVVAPAPAPIVPTPVPRPAPEPVPVEPPVIDKPRDPRLAARLRQQQAAKQPPPAPVQPTVPERQAAPPEDDERTQLILQVLQLTEEQIAMLPAEQREGVLQLREQIRVQQQGSAS